MADKLVANKTGTLTVTVAWAASGRTFEHMLQLVPGASIGDVLLQPELASDPSFSQAVAESSAVGVWGRVRNRATVLRDGDRIELYAPLKADPKEQRRKRAN